MFRVAGPLLTLLGSRKSRIVLSGFSLLSFCMEFGVYFQLLYLRFFPYVKLQEAFLFMLLSSSLQNQQARQEAGVISTSPLAFSVSAKIIARVENITHVCSVVVMSHGKSVCCLCSVHWIIAANLK